MSIYDPLAEWLEIQTDNQVEVAFSQVENILKRTLPPTARTTAAWWGNNLNRHTQAKAWLNAGFHTEQVDLSRQTLVFRRIGNA